MQRQKILVLLSLMVCLTLFAHANEGSEGSEGSFHQSQPKQVIKQSFSQITPDDFIYDKKLAKNLDRLIVLHAGRFKPLIALSREFTWALAPLKETYFLQSTPNGVEVKKADPLNVFLDMSFQSEKWMDIPLLPIADKELQQLCLLTHSPRQKHPYISVNEFLALMHESEPFANVIARNVEAMSSEGEVPKAQSSLDDKARSLIQAVQWVQGVGELGVLMIIPHSEDVMKPWLSVSEALSGPYLSEQKKLEFESVFSKLKESWIKGDREAFDKHSKELVGFQQKMLQQLSFNQENMDRITLEVTYWRSRPFMIGSFLSFFSLMFILPAFGARGRFRLTLKVIGFLFVLCSISMMVWGFWMRATIADRGPIHSIYETVVYATMGIMIFALLLECFSRKGYALLIGALLGALGGICASKLGSRMDPNFQHMMPVLRSGWLVVHVQVIILGYAAALLAAGLGHAILFARLWLKRTDETIKTLDKLCYRSVQFTVLFLTAGILLGAWWANESWGRYWGWDPKETWALISLLIFLALVHLRHTGSVRQLGTASLSIIGGMMVIFCWWGVNYVLGQGLHAYATGFSEKMATPAVIYYFVELLFLAWALSKYLEDRSKTKKTS